MTAEKALLSLSEEDSLQQGCGAGVVENLQFPLPLVFHEYRTDNCAQIAY